MYLILMIFRALRYFVAGLTAIYGTKGGGGIMVITTKHGNNISVQNEITFISPHGYYKSKQFYSPKYDSPNSDSKIADLRTTIYWKPIIQTDKEGNAFLNIIMQTANAAIA